MRGITPCISGLVITPWREGWREGTEETKEGRRGRRGEMKGERVVEEGKVEREGSVLITATARIHVAEQACYHR